MTVVYGDTIQLKDGTELKSVSVVRMTGTMVVIKYPNGQTETIEYSRIRNIVYAPVSQLRPRGTGAVLPKTAIPTSNEAFKLIQGKWDDLEQQRLRASEKLFEIGKAIEIAASSEGTENAGQSIGQDDLNSLLQQRAAVEAQLSKISNEQEALRNNVLQLAQEIGKHGDLPEQSEGLVQETNNEIDEFLVMNALLPGTEQWRTGRYVESGLMAIGLLFAADTWWNAKSRYDLATERQSAFDLLSASFLIQNSVETSLQFNLFTRQQANIASIEANRYNTALLMLGSIYAINLLDLRTKGGLRTYFSLLPGQDGLGFGLTYRF